MIDLSTLKPGDKVTADSGRVYEVAAITASSFTVWLHSVPQQEWLIEARRHADWSKVEPPLIDPAQVWALMRSSDRTPYLVPSSGEPEKVWLGHDTAERLRITAYEVVA